METLIFDKPGKIRKNLPELEKRLNVKINYEGKKITISGNSIDEYEASMVLEALNFGFPLKSALSLKDEEMMLTIIPIKRVSRRKDLEVVRGRVIGREGKTKRTIEDVSNCEIALKNNEVAIIGSAESIEEAKAALTKLISGAKEANVYKYLEDRNRDKKERDFDLNLKVKK